MHRRAEHQAQRAAGVTLRDVTRDNWEECCRLSVREDQASFVASNVYSLAESRFNDEMVPLAVYAGEQMVGFAMYGLEPRDQQYWIYRLMIDRAHQGKGYGRAAMIQLLARLRETAGRGAAVIGYEPENAAATRLYASLGFRETGLAPWGEMVAQVDFAVASDG